MTKQIQDNKRYSKQDIKQHGKKGSQQYGGQDSNQSGKQERGIGGCLVDVILYPAVLLVLLAVLGSGFGIRPYITMSGSMEPAIRTGSLCIVDTKVGYDQIQQGDIIAFRAGESLVTHRVIKITTEGLETKGDANETSDGISTTADNLAGKTLFSIPYAGYVLHALQQPEALAVLGILFVTIFVWESIDKKYSAGNVVKDTVKSL